MAGTKSGTLHESEFVKLLLQSNILTEGQLKAVYDYQRSLGGSVADILVKLNMVSRSDLEAMVRAALEGTDVATVFAGKTNLAIDGSKLDFEGLKLHHRLIDKLPPEFVEKFFVVIFFPFSGLDSRKLIVGHGRELEDAIGERIRAFLGVDLYTLKLDEALAAEYVVKYFERAKKPVPESIAELAAQKAQKKSSPAPAAQGNRSTPDSAADHAGVASGSSAHSEASSPSAVETADQNESADLNEDGPVEQGLRARQPSAQAPQVESPRPDLFEEPSDPSTQESSRGMSRFLSDGDTRGDVDAVTSSSLNVEWVALTNLLVKKRILTREEVRVEVELLKRNISRG